MPWIVARRVPLAHTVEIYWPCLRASSRLRPSGGVNRNFLIFVLSFHCLGSVRLARIELQTKSDATHAAHTQTQANDGKKTKTSRFSA